MVRTIFRCRSGLVLAVIACIVGGASIVTIARAADGAPTPEPTAYPDFHNPGNPGLGGSWEWRGAGEPADGDGNWHNPETGESWHPDLDHGPPYGPHWDFTRRDMDLKKRWYEDGTWANGNAITPAAPAVTPMSQHVSGPEADVQWTVTVAKDHLYEGTLVFDTGDGTTITRSIPKGEGTVTFELSHTYSVEPEVWWAGAVEFVTSTYIQLESAAPAPFGRGASTGGGGGGGGGVVLC